MSLVELVLPPVAVPDNDPAPYTYIRDAITEASRVHSLSGARYALAYTAELERMIAQKTWRSQAAFDLLALIRREAFAAGQLAAIPANMSVSA